MAGPSATLRADISDYKAKLDKLAQEKEVQDSELQNLKNVIGAKHQELEDQKHRCVRFWLGWMGVGGLGFLNRLLCTAPRALVAYRARGTGVWQFHDTKALHPILSALAHPHLVWFCHHLQHQRRFLLALCPLRCNRSARQPTERGWA